MKPLIHSATSSNIDNFLASPSHALLIIGPEGSGKGTISKFIACAILKIESDKIADHPYVMHLRDLDKGVSIENIRNAQTFMQLKTPGKESIRRVLIVEQGESMSLEAQNAFLKLLEEPPADSLIIITTSTIEKLLPTIKSRTQQIRILPPSLDQVKEYFQDNYSELDINKAYFTCEGYMGMLTAILNDDSDNFLVESINTAKSLLAGTQFDRLAKVEEISKMKSTDTLLFALERVCHAALTQAAANSKPVAENWTKRLKAVLEAREQLARNVQTKLVLTSLMLKI